MCLAVMSEQLFDPGARGNQADTQRLGVTRRSAERSSSAAPPPRSGRSPPRRRRVPSAARPSPLAVLRPSSPTAIPNHCAAWPGRAAPIAASRQAEHRNRFNASVPGRLGHGVRARAGAGAPRSAVVPPRRDRGPRAALLPRSTRRRRMRTTAGGGSRSGAVPPRGALGHGRPARQSRRAHPAPRRLRPPSPSRARRALPRQRLPPRSGGLAQ